MSVPWLGDENLFKLPGRGYTPKDDAARQLNEEQCREMNERDAAINERQNAEARAQGYATYMDLLTHEWKLEQEERERFHAGTAAKMGIPVKELLNQLEIESIRKHNEARANRKVVWGYHFPEAEEGPDICRCKGDETCDFWFCPNAGETYHSMDMDDHFLQLMQEQKRPKLEEINIQPGDRSHRVPSLLLEKYWGQDSQGGHVQMPQWTEQDGFVQDRMPVPQAPQVTRSIISPSPTPEYIPMYTMEEIKEFSGSGKLWPSWPETLRLRRERQAKLDDMQKNVKRASGKSFKETAKVQKAITKAHLPNTRSRKSTKLWELDSNGTPRSVRRF